MRLFSYKKVVHIPSWSWSLDLLTLRRLITLTISPSSYSPFLSPIILQFLTVLLVKGVVELYVTSYLKRLLFPQNLVQNYYLQVKKLKGLYDHYIYVFKIDQCFCTCLYSFFLFSFKSESSLDILCKLW